MNRVTATLIVCGALMLATGCGSSRSSTSASTSGSSTPATTSGGFKANTTPKFVAPPSAAPVRSGAVQIAYRNITIAPDTVKVKVGSTITWTNFDSVEHNVTSKSGPSKFASKNISEGQTFQVTVTTPGVIHYVCTIHPTSMNGTIQVIR